MRLPLLAVALLVVVAVPAGAVGAPATHGPAATAETTQSTLSGTVTYLNGSAVEDATVLVGNMSRFEDASSDELRDLAADPPEDVATATTDADGEYTLTVNDSVDAEAVVAVSAAGTSTIRRYQSGELDLTLRTTEPLAFETEPISSEPGGRAAATFTLEHTGDRAVEGLKLTLGALPDGWNVARASSDSATWHESNRTFVWGTVEPGETIEAEILLFVALGAIDEEPETFSFPMFAGSDTHPVSTEDIELTVQYPTERTETDAPGFGATATLGALAVLAVALLTRRRD